MSVDPTVCHGKVCIKGTRIVATVVLDNFAAGLSLTEIQQSYLTLMNEAIWANIVYAADIFHECILALLV